MERGARTHLRRDFSLVAAHLVICFWLLIFSAHEAQAKSGVISTDEVWSGEIDITGDVTISQNVTVRIDPGALIRFSGNTALNIYGRLDAVGTSDTPITFTSSSPTPTKGIWKGIYFYDSSLDLSSIDHAVIDYAARGVSCTSASPGIRNSVLSNNSIGIYLSSSSSPIDGCTIKDSRDYGIYVDGNHSNTEIANNQIVRCNNGIHVSSYYSNPSIRNNIIRGNAVYGIHIADYNNPSISLNTLHGNGTAIYINIPNGYTATISSNIITLNNCGINRNSGGCSLSWNDLWENTIDYISLSAGASDLSVDPLYEDPMSDDFRLKEGSPLTGAGQDGGGLGAYGGNGSPPLLVVPCSTAPTTSGSFTRNEIWSGTIEIVGDVTVPAGFTVKIEPGTIIEFSNNTGLNIYGKLNAAGTSTSPVTFTSISPTPTRGIWRGITFYDSSLDASSLAHIVLEYATNGV